MHLCEPDTAAPLSRLIGGLYPAGYIHPHAKDQDKTAFEAWFRSLTHRARSKVLIRMSHMECGNFGDCRPVGEGVSESRIHYGPGYRLYFLRSGEAIHVLLLGGSKATQAADIRKAQAMAKNLKNGGSS